MIRLQSTLYGFAFPFAALPLMDFSFSQIGPYLRGEEFRAFMAEFVVQLTSGVVDAVILAAFGIGL
jgi:hypothetical protein